MFMVGDTFIHLEYPGGMEDRINLRTDVHTIISLGNHGAVRFCRKGSSQLYLTHVCKIQLYTRKPIYIILKELGYV